MSLSQLDVLMAFLESVKNISNNFIEVSINELYRESFIYRGVGGYIYGWILAVFFLYENIFVIIYYTVYELSI